MSRELVESLVVAKFAIPKKYGRREGYIQKTNEENNLELR